MGSIPANGNSVPALEKGLMALECVHSNPSPLSLTEISRSCGRSVSEMQRVVPYLAERGYFVRDERGLYRASSKLFRLANRHHPYHYMAAIALPAMRDFAAKTGENIHLSALEFGKLLIVADVPGTSYLRLSATVGSLHVPRESVSGRVLLSFGEAGSLAAAKRIAKDGYEFSASHLFKGVKDLAVPVILPGRQVIAALASFWVDSVKTATSWKKRLLPELKKCADRISSSIEPSTQS